MASMAPVDTERMLNTSTKLNTKGTLQTANTHPGSTAASSGAISPAPTSLEAWKVAEFRA